MANQNFPDEDYPTTTDKKRIKDFATGEISFANT